MPLREASGLIWSQVLPSRSLKSTFSPSCQLLFLRTSQLSVFGLDNWPLAFVLASLEIFGGSRSQAERGPLWRKRRGPEAVFTFQNWKPLAFLETVFSQVLIHDFVLPSTRKGNCWKVFFCIDFVDFSFALTLLTPSLALTLLASSFALTLLTSSFALTLLTSSFALTLQSTFYKELNFGIYGSLWRFSAVSFVSSNGFFTYYFASISLCHISMFLGCWNMIV